MAMLRGEVDLTDDVTAYAAIGKQKTEGTMQGLLTPRLMNADGTYRFVALAQLGTISETVSAQAGLQAKATTGPVSHQFSLNLQRSRRQSGTTSQFDVNGYTQLTNIYNPEFGAAPAFGTFTDPKIGSESTMSGVSFADTMTMLDGRIQFIAGLRRQKVEVTNFNTTTGAQTSNYDSAAWTPSFALTFKPRENISLYANYIQALQPGLIVGTTYANAGEILSPYVSKQYEVGTKVDWGQVTTTLALFQITKASAISIPNAAGGLPTLRANGEQRNRGLELNVYGEAARGARLIGGITLLDAIRAKTQGGLQDGNRAQGVPRFRAVIGGEWDAPFAPALTLTGRVIHTSNQVTTDQVPDLKIPSWTTLDLGARYVVASGFTKEPVLIRLNIDNVLGKNYWATAGDYLLYQGAPRTVRLSATFAF